MNNERLAISGEKLYQLCLEERHLRINRSFNDPNLGWVWQLYGLWIVLELYSSPEKLVKRLCELRDGDWGPQSGLSESEGQDASKILARILGKRKRGAESIREVRRFTGQFLQHLLFVEGIPASVGVVRLSRLMLSGGTESLEGARLALRLWEQIGGRLFELAGGLSGQLRPAEGGKGTGCAADGWLNCLIRGFRPKRTAAAVGKSGWHSIGWLVRTLTCGFTHSDPLDKKGPTIFEQAFEFDWCLFELHPDNPLSLSDLLQSLLQGGDLISDQSLDKPIPLEPEEDQSVDLISDQSLDKPIPLEPEEDQSVALISDQSLDKPIPLEPEEDKIHQHPAMAFVGAWARLGRFASECRTLTEWLLLLDGQLQDAAQLCDADQLPPIFRFCLQGNRASILALGEPVAPGGRLEFVGTLITSPRGAISGPRREWQAQRPHFPFGLEGREANAAWISAALAHTIVAKRENFARRAMPSISLFPDYWQQMGEWARRQMSAAPADDTASSRALRWNRPPLAEGLADALSWRTPLRLLQQSERAEVSSAKSVEQLPHGMADGDQDSSTGRQRPLRQVRALERPWSGQSLFIVAAGFLAEATLPELLNVERFHVSQRAWDLYSARDDEALTAYLQGRPELERLQQLAMGKLRSPKAAETSTNERRGGGRRVRKARPALKTPKVQSLVVLWRGGLFLELESFSRFLEVDKAKLLARIRRREKGLRNLDKLWYGGWIEVVDDSD